MSPQTYLIMHIYFLTYILKVGTDTLVCPYFMAFHQLILTSFR